MSLRYCLCLLQVFGDSRKRDSSSEDHSSEGYERSREEGERLLVG